ncbi:hypothetical protein BURPS1106B_0415 [Burkholderia pseudomallei 1106b]|uniref:Uncharacterized protein n=1 Tax=Burkholderia pseudomallei (strain 1106a) TaxID=357348 RepID=A3P5J9_BURP0|nr:hypothetical protein BURPS1106A_A1575 [Burkholderia pseudomallei 1106a]EES22404.1 hypothetical protein BURPS1106B_0415 [Burkholderia pseudomallei 1106b]
MRPPSDARGAAHRLPAPVVERAASRRACAVAAACRDTSPRDAPRTPAPRRERDGTAFLPHRGGRQ